MRRFISVVLVATFAASAFAHGDDSHFENKQDVKVTITKVNGGVYMLQGRGGNMGAVNGMEGILLVDDDYKVVSEKLREALKELGSDTPRIILNTHWHGDHTEGNQTFGKESVIVAQENVRKRLMQVNTIFGEKVPAYPSFALPMITYTESLTLHINGEEIRAVHFPHGHTDGDTVVFFDTSNVVHLGDDFFAGKFPFIDLDNGGSVQGLINNLNQLIPQIRPDAKLIPGHGPISTLDDLKAYRQTLVETVDIVQRAMKKRHTLDEIKKAGFPEKYRSWGDGFIKSDAWIETIYKSLARK